MKIFSAAQIKKWDNYTIENEPVSSIDLMERAALACVSWLEKNFGHQFSFIIFCGTGNNGGDGLAIARLLNERNYRVKVFVTGDRGTADFERNKQKWQRERKVHRIREPSDFPDVHKSVVIDAIFGSGLNRKPEGVFKELIEYLNGNARLIVSIDVPAGLFTDKTSKNNIVICSDYVLSFQNYKLAFLTKENSHHLGKIVLMDIQLSEEFEKEENPEFELTDSVMMQEIYKKRQSFTHKGNFGHGCLIAGSYGMMGAAILSARASLRSGIGKLTCFIPEKGYEIMQISVPEAMTKVYGTKHIEDVEGLSAFDTIAIGPGIGRHFSHFQLLKTVFTNFKNPLVVDADALNTIAEFPSLMQYIPANSVLTPHPKEFERMFGKTESDFETISLALKKAAAHSVNIIVKGHRTFIATSNGKGFFNSTGNAGMATAGAGDVLTGIIGGLIAQRYSPQNACLLGTYIHGLAGDLAAEALSEESLIAGDLVNYLPKAIRKIVDS